MQAYSTGCCSRPERTYAPVDACFAESGIRLRHLPASICLNCRHIDVPNLVASDSLARSIRDCLDNRPSHLTIVRAIPRDANGEQYTKTGYGAAWLDIGIGENAGLVVERVKGWWNADEGSAMLTAEGQELRERLAHMDLSSGCRFFPSLLYDTPAHPRSIQIELTTRCNLSCSYCTQSELKIKQDVPLDRLLATLDRIDFSKVDNVDFTGLGEPMLHPQLPLVIDEIRRRGQPSSIRVVTNGTVLTPARVKALCAAGITSIAFSIDSVNPIRFAQSRGGARLEKVLANLEYLVDYRRQQGIPLEIKIKTVLIDNPYEEAEGLLQLSARLGIAMPHFSCLDNRSTAKEQYDDSWLQDDWSDNGGAELAAWAQKRWRDLTAANAETGTGQGFQPKASNEFMDASGQPPHLCRWAVDAAFVSATGEMLPCCEQMIDIPRNYHGSLLQKDLRALWQDELLWGYRLPLAAGLVPAGCAGCVWAPAHHAEAHT